MLFFDEIYSAILGAAFFCAVGGDWLVGALACWGEAGFGNPLFYQGGHDGFGPLLTQRIIDFVASGGVTMALYLELQAGFSFINLTTRFISTMDSGLRSALPVSKVMA